MRPEEQILICVARRSLNQAVAAQLRALLANDLDWPNLVATAHHHCLAPMLYQHLGAIDSTLVPAYVLDRLQRDIHHNTRSNLFLTGELLKLLDLLAEHGIRAVSFKGPTLALKAYGDVGLRQFGDLDILVHRRDIPKVKDLLISRNFKSTLELTKTQQAALLRFDSAYTFKNQQGVVLDIHWNLIERHLAFDVDLHGLWDRVEPVIFNGKELLTLSGEDLLLLLCLHGFTHLWERLGWICDVASLIDSRDDLDWELILRNATTLGARKILSLGLLLARDLLGASVPPEVLRSLAPDRRVKSLAEQIRAQLFTEQSVPQGLFAEAATLMSLRERRRDRFKAGVRLALTPRSYDWMFVSVPDSLFFLYYLLRPFRLAAKYGARLFNGSARQPNAKPDKQPAPVLER